MYKERRFLLNTTALYLGIKCLEDRNMLSITDAIKKDLFKAKEFFRRDEREIVLDNVAMRLYKTLDSITLGAKVWKREKWQQDS